MSDTEITKEVRAIFAEDARGFLAQMEKATAALLEAQAISPKLVRGLASARHFQAVDDAAQSVRGSASSVEAEFLASSAAVVEELARRGQQALETLLVQSKRAHALATFCADATREMGSMVDLYLDGAAEEAAWLSMVLQERAAEARKNDDETSEGIVSADEVSPPEPVAAASQDSDDVNDDEWGFSDEERVVVDDPQSMPAPARRASVPALARVFQAEAREVMLALKGHVETYLRTRQISALDAVDPLLNTLIGSAASVELPYLAAQASEALAALVDLRRTRVGTVVPRFTAAMNRLLSTVAIASIDAAARPPSDVALAEEIPDVYVAELRRTIEAATAIAEKLASEEAAASTTADLATEASKLFHRLKGTSLIVGAPLVAEEASTLMEACGLLKDAHLLSVAIREGAERLVNLLPHASQASVASFEAPPAPPTMPPLTTRSAAPSQRPLTEPPGIISDGLLAIFREEIQGLLPMLTESLGRLAVSPRDTSALESLYRAFHTMKGTAAAVGQMRVSELASELEIKLEAAIEERSLATAELVAEVRAGARAVLDGVGIGSDAAVFDPEIEELSSDDLLEEAPAESSDPRLAAPGRAASDAEAENFEFDDDQVDSLVESLSELPAAMPVEAPPAVTDSTVLHGISADEWDAQLRRCEATIDRLVASGGGGAGGDPELAAIFNEEVEQLAPSIGEAFEQLLDQPSDRAPVRVLERILHTLKGSAATVDRKETSAAAEALRAAVEAIATDGSAIPLETKRLLALQSAVERLLEAATKTSAAAAPEPGGEFAFEEEPAEARPDDELLKIFQQEARESLIALQGHVETLLTTPQSVYAAEYIERLFHTLKGAAATVGFTDIARQAADLQTMMEELLAEKRTPTPEFMDTLLERTNDLLAKIGVAPLSLTRSGESGSVSPALASSGHSHGQSSDGLDRKIFTGEVKAICRQASARARELLAATDASAQLQLRGDLADLFHRLKGTAATVDATAIAREAERATEAARGKLPVRDLVETVRSTIVRIADLAGFERARPRPSAGATRGAAETAREQVDVADDAELWEAFNQECTELIDALEKLVLSLEEAAQPKETLEEIFRLVHTLKGAVNTVGLTPTGKTLHVTEDFLEHLAKVPIIPPMRTVSGVLIEVLKQVRQNLRTARNGWVETSLPAVHAMIEAALRPRGGGDGGRREKGSLASGNLYSLFDSAALFGSVNVISEKTANGSHPSRSNGSHGSQDSGDVEERAYIRVATSRLDSLMNLAGELVVSRSRLASRVGTLRLLYGELGRSRVRLTSTVETFREQYEFANLGGKTLRRGRAKNEPAADESSITPVTPRVNAETFGELELDEYEDIHVLSRSLAEIGNDFEEAFRTLSSELANFSDDADSLGGIISGIQGEVTRARMVPLEAVFARLRFPIRDAATRDAKEVAVVTEGADVNIDKTIADAILQPMLHLVRNAVAHGIETPARRISLKKPQTGRVRLSARQESGQIVIEVADDGAGLDLAALRARGIREGLITPDVALDDPRVKDLVFAAGLSTKDVATDIAGRGVGGDVVKRSIERLNGAIRVDSTPGKGTVFAITLPLTLAITRALLVEDGGAIYAVPLYFAERILDAEALTAGTGSERRLILDGVYHRVRPLAHYLGERMPTTQSRGPALVLRVGDDRLVLQVDAVLAQEEIVVKKAGALLEGHPLFAGVTLRGTGDLVLILDVPGVLAESGRVRRPTDDVAGGAKALPVAEAAPKAVKEAKAEKPKPPPVPAKKKTEGKPGQAALGRVRALVVDDSLSVRKVAEAQLKGIGVEVAVAVDGVDGLAKLREGHFDVVFTDLEMPRMHGYDFIRQMRLLPAYQALPVVVVSSRSSQKHQDHARSVGATDYLTKPFTPQSLEAVIRKWLKK